MYTRVFNSNNYGGGEVGFFHTFSETFESLISLLLSVGRSLDTLVDSSSTRLSALRADDNLEEFRESELIGRAEGEEEEIGVKHGEANNET